MGREARLVKMRKCATCDEAYSNAADLAKHGIVCKAAKAINDRLEKVGLVWG